MKLVQVKDCWSFQTKVMNIFLRTKWMWTTFSLNINRFFFSVSNAKTVMKTNTEVCTNTASYNPGIDLIIINSLLTLMRSLNLALTVHTLAIIYFIVCHTVISNWYTKWHYFTIFHWKPFWIWYQLWRRKYQSSKPVSNYKVRCVILYIHYYIQYTQASSQDLKKGGSERVHTWVNKAYGPGTSCACIHTY